MLPNHLVWVVSAVVFCGAFGLNLGAKECGEVKKFEDDWQKVRQTRPQPSSTAQKEWFEVSDLMKSFALENLQHRCREAAASAPIRQDMYENRIKRMKALRLTSPEVAEFRQKWLVAAEFLSNNVHDAEKIRMLHQIWQDEAARLDRKYLGAD